MRKLLILLFVPMILLAQVDKRIVFADYFTNPAETQGKGGFISNVTYQNGSAVCATGSNSKIVYSKVLKGTFTIRLRLSSFTGYSSPASVFLLDFRNTNGAGTGYLFNATSNLSKSSGTSYVDNSAATVITSTTKEIILSGIAINCNSIYLNSRYSSENFNSVSYDLIEIYSGTLTAQEVSILYKNSTYQPLANTNLALNLYVKDGQIVEQFGKTITNTNVGITKVSGSRYAMEFNKVNSKLDLGTDNVIGTGNVTVMAWVKARGYGESNAGRMIFNGKFYVYLYVASACLSITSDDVANKLSATNLFPNNFNKYMFVAVSITSSGIANFYINGNLSGTANQTSGTRTIGTTNLIIGNISTSAGTFDGQISTLQVYQRILSAEEIMNEYLRTKQEFGL